MAEDRSSPQADEQVDDRAESAEQVDKGILEAQIFDIYVRGETRNSRIATRLGLRQHDVSRITDTPDFQRNVKRAKDDIVEAARDRIKRNAYEYAEELDKMARSEDLEPRTKLAALKEALYQAEVKRPDKQKEMTPEAYIRLLQKYLEPEEDRPKPSAPRKVNTGDHPSNRN